MVTDPNRNLCSRRHKAFHRGVGRWSIRKLFSVALDTSLFGISWSLSLHQPFFATLQFVGSPFSTSCTSKSVHCRVSLHATLARSRCWKKERKYRRNKDHVQGAQSSHTPMTKCSEPLQPYPNNQVLKLSPLL